MRGWKLVILWSMLLFRSIEKARVVRRGIFPATEKRDCGELYRCQMVVGVLNERAH